ncbi:LCP family protein [Bacillus sp. MRMR6]|uniref:LCP family glycopolymer transferase n=1 Tax=Bacillus sp. MRMR6 TaxID=1928617 RepID=UPI0009533940|nr:LCP family protein [Bacillus sp. MRMR6]OLS37817.1 LytR family transcriptional regulator [Bacillus sp. MRMR6]
MNTRLGKNTRKRKKKSIFLRFLLSIFLLFAVGGGIYAYNMYSDVASAVQKMHQPISREVSEKREEEIEFHRKDPLSILLVGVDERDGDAGRTDSMLVITINPDLKTTKILSIPRDTRTMLIDQENPKNNWLDKINHAYAYGGIEMSINTVEHFLNIPIDYYTEVNMHGFKEIVNAVGGIDVNNQYEFELDGVTLQVGEQHLDGREALSYARMRKADPRGDFGRQERQREVVSKIIKKAATFSTLTNYEDLLTALEENIKTNLTFDDIVGIQAKYKSAANNIEKMEIEGEGQTIKDIWYFMVEEETRQSLSNQLREHLGLTADTVAVIDQY